VKQLCIGGSQSEKESNEFQLQPTNQSINQPKPKPTNRTNQPNQNSPSNLQNSRATMHD